MSTKNRPNTSFDNQHVNNFIKILETLKPSKHRYEVFSDWLVLTAASLYAWKQDKKNEEEYSDIAKQYTEEELEKHVQLLGITVQAFKEKEQDFLGEVFSKAKLTNSKNGQFFTPYCVSYILAETLIGKQELPATRVCRVNDPCCGAGGMLVAAASVMMKSKEFNYQQNALFVAQDIDARCAQMTYIQLTLLGVPAIVICGNSLSMECYWQKETIGYHLASMNLRLAIESMIASKKNADNAIEQKTEKTKELIAPMEINLPSPQEYAQGELFAAEENL